MAPPGDLGVTTRHRHTAAASRTPHGLHLFAVVLAAATLALIFVGGLVTSTGSGLAVPDWPLSFGQFFPRMVGGVFYEHGHRMVAATVGALTVAFAVATWLVESPPIVRRLALAAIATVVAQGLLGGLTVLFLLPPAISSAHACLAQAFLCLTVALAVLTHPDWTPAPPTPADPGLARLAAATAAVVYGQLVLGAVMRHTGAGLAIPDFPLAFGRVVPPFESAAVVVHFLHRLGALAVATLVLWTAARTVRTHPAERAVVRPALLAVALVAAQITLGALTIWTRKAVLPTTAHVAIGAAILGTTVVWALRARRTAGATSGPTRALLATERAPA
ncbi:MAG: heme A synthase [Deltaproteobacteria bacterium]|nr:heme A synthase [Deltaproteobacteria bacterium]